MKALLPLLLVAATGGPSTDCIYLNGYTLQRYFSVVDEETLTELYTVPWFPEATGPLRGMAVDGDYAYTGNQGLSDGGGGVLPGRVLEIDLVTRAAVREFPTGNDNLGLALANGKLYTPNSFPPHSVSVVDPALATSEMIDDVGDPSAIAASPDGSRVFVMADREVFVVDTSTNQPIQSFQSERSLGRLLATNDLVFVEGVGPNGTTGGLIVFERRGNAYAEIWRAPLGFCFQLALADGKLFCASRRGFMASVDLDPPHEGRSFILGGDGAGDLNDIEEYHGVVYVAGEDGLFRFDPHDPEGAEIIFAGSFREVEIAACPSVRMSFTGDADCDSILTSTDVDTTMHAVYDLVVRARCNADCNGDGGVTAADLPCAVRALAESPVVERPTPTPSPTRTPLPSTPTRTRTWTPAPCSTNLDCPGVAYCKKQPGDCDGTGACVRPPDTCIPFFDPVCGCDGHTYETAACAAVERVNVDYGGTCVE